MLPGPLVEFERRHERHLSVELVIANSVVVRELVREGRAEFGIAALEQDGARRRGSRALDFCEDEVVVAVPPGHPWAAPQADPARRLRLDADGDARPERQHPPDRRGGAARARPRAGAAAGRGRQHERRCGTTALSEEAPVLLSRLAVARLGDDLVICRVRRAALPERRFVFVLGGEEALAASARALLAHLPAAPPKP